MRRWLGLCNNFAYVVMLSAAHDILKQQETNTLPVRVPPVTRFVFSCWHLILAVFFFFSFLTDTEFCNTTVFLKYLSFLGPA